MSFSSFLKDSRAQFDKASEKGRNYYHKDTHSINDFNPLKQSNKPPNPAEAISARPLGALRDPNSFPAPPVHRIAHGQAAQPAPNQYAPAQQAAYPGYQQPPQPVANQGYQPPQPGVNQGYQPPPPNGAPQAYSSAQIPQTNPAVPQYPGNAQQSSYQPHVASGQYGAYPPQAQAQVQAQVPAAQPSFEASQTPPPLPNSTRPVMTAPTVAHPPLPARDSVPTPAASLPDPSSFPPPPTHSVVKQHTVPATKATPSLPPRSAAPPGLPARTASVHVPSPASTPTPVATSPSPAFKKKPPPAPPKKFNKPAHLSSSSVSSAQVPDTYALPVAVPTTAPYPEAVGTHSVPVTEPPPPYAHAPAASEEPAVESPATGGAARLAKQFEQMNLNMVAELNRRTSEFSSKSSVSSASSQPVQPAQQTYHEPEHTSPVPKANTPSSVATSVQHKKAPPKPPKKSGLVSSRLNAISTGAGISPQSTASHPAPVQPAATHVHPATPVVSGEHHGQHVSETAASIASVVAAAQNGVSRFASKAATSLNPEPQATPPPINYATRPDIGESTMNTQATTSQVPAAVPVPARAPVPGPATPARAPSAQQNDPQGQYDLNLSTLWFTQSARSLQLPPTLQGLNYTFTVSSIGSKRVLVLALRVSETLAIVKFKLEWEASNPLGTVTVERKDIAPPPPLTQQQLAQARDQFCESVAAFTESVRNTQVGDGECWTLAKQAFDATPGVMPPQGYTFGAVVYEAEGLAPAPVAYNDRIARGDVIQFLSARIETKSNQGIITRQVILGAPNHTAVVVNVSPDNRTVDVLHQNLGGVRTVQPGTFNLDEVTAGHVTVYRPVWKDWAGELEAKWE